MSGSDGYVYPNNNITREEFVKLVLCALDLYEEGKSVTFDDVTTADWAYSYIASAVEKGIIKGVSETKFGKGLNITREDMAVILNRAIGKESEFKNTDTSKFNDYNEISAYAKDSVLLLSEMGIINGFGDGSFMPKGTATRAQAAQMIYNYLISK